MILRLSVRDSGTTKDIEMIADPDTSVASVLAAALPTAIGGRPCFVGVQLLDPATTVAESPLVLGCTISVGEPGPDPRALPPGAVGAVRVIAGPDTGLIAWLTPGEHAFARHPDARVSLRDADVSRRHAVLRVATDGQAWLSDIGSENGTAIDGSPVTEPVALAPEAIIEIGGTRLRWVPLPEHRLRTVRSPDGHLDFDRAFAPAPAVSRAEIALPQKDTVPRNIVTMLVSGLAPAAMGGVMALLLRQPSLLLFGLFGLATAAGSYLVDRHQRRSRERTYTRDKAEAERRIHALVLTEGRLNRVLAPDELDLVLAATGAGRGLWPRNADSAHGLRVRVGTEDRPAAVDLDGDPWPGFEPPMLLGTPVTIDLREIGVLGIVGLPADTEPLLRWVLVQLAVLRSPDDLRLVVITSTDGETAAWTAWLPHTTVGEDGVAPCWVGNTDATRADRIAELKDLITRRKSEQGAMPVHFDNEVVVVLDGALALRHLPGMREVLRDGPSVGVLVVCVDRHGMNESRGECAFQGTSLLVTRSRDSHPLAVRPEGIRRTAAANLARALAPMRDRHTLARAETAVPYPVRLLDLLGVRVPSVEDVAALWAKQDGPTTQVVLGADGSGSVSVDLARQGPHTMLAGATGAGKSILLQTLVTSLLLVNRPDELNLVLVDFKGGSAFLPFQKCAHVVGLIRSTGETPADIFDEAAATRVLASVRAEVRRRESKLARYGGEIDEYWKARRRTGDLPALPRLVMIFDEFARVLETSPDFLKELVNVAAKGRSLGMHLVLATQSLQGKLTAELKNNIDLRISLRQNEPADSVEVLGVPDAASIPGRLFGRGMILCTKDATRTPRVFQSGYLGNPPPTGIAAPAQVRLVEWSTLGIARPATETARNGATDQDLSITAIEDAARELALPAPFQPLRPPLPATLRRSDLHTLATVRPAPTAVAFGLVDNPDDQSQPTAHLDLSASDRLMVAGGPQSGRTTFAHTFIRSLADTFGPDEAHVYIVEHQPSGLDTYADLPHCGAVMSPLEPDRIRRLVTWLAEEVQRRKAARFTPNAPSPPWITLLIDGWEHFENRADPAFVETPLLNTVRDIITAGAPVGVHVIAIGGQAMLATKLPDLYSQRLLLPFPKDETRRHNLPTASVLPPTVPGRAIDAGTGHHIQISFPPTMPTHKTGVDESRLPHRFPSMPTHIAADDLPRPPESPTWIPLGVGGPDVSPMGIDLFDVGPHLLLVSGPPGSGRTTAATTIIKQLRALDIGVLAVAPPRSPLSHLPHDSGIRLITGTTIADAALREAAATFEDSSYAVVADDCEQLTVTPSQDGFVDSPTLLQEITEPGSIGRKALVLCGDATPILTGQRRSLTRALTEVITTGTLVLLSPTGVLNVREHGLTLEADQLFAGPPGRGYISKGRTAYLLHLATP
jgi:S-DNA-T family DNA segregation ATPase FtsK/SpoIIIE